MRITKISIKNIYAFDDISLNFQSLNAIVGPNNSGKTNLGRLLNLFKTQKTIQYLTLPRQIKLNENSPSRIVITLELSEKESKFLYNVFFQQDLTPSQISDSVKEVTIGILWNDTVNESSQPSQVIIRLNNGITMQGSDVMSLYYTEKLDDALVNLNVPEYANNNTNTQKRFTDIQHINPGIFEASNKFFSAFMENTLSEKIISTFKILSLRKPTAISYDQQHPKQFISDIFDFVSADKKKTMST